MRKTGIGIIGAGFIGKQHIEALGRIPHTEVLWVVDSDEGAARKTAEEFGVPRHAGNYEAVLADPGVDAVHICTPSVHHCKAVLDAARAGKHLFCEKPLALDLDEAKAMLRAVKGGGVAHAVNFNYRHNVMVWEMRERIRDGRSGRILSVYGQYLQDWLLYETDYNWRLDPKIGGKSRALADIGSHCFDTAQFVLDRKIVEVYAKLITVHPARHKVGGSVETFADGGGTNTLVPVHTEDLAYVMARFEDGTPGLFHISQVQAGKKNNLALSLSGAVCSLEWDQEHCDRLHIGRKNSPNETLIADPVLLSQWVRGATRLPGGHAVGWHDALRNSIGRFYEAVREERWLTGERDYADFSDGLYTMRLIEACLQSGEQDRWVQV